MPAPYAVAKRLRDGRTAVRVRAPGGLEFVAVAPARFLTVGADLDGPPLDMEIAGIFDSLAKAASKVIRNKWVQRGAGLVVAAYTGVPPGVTMATMQKSGELIELARGGDERAKRRVREIAERARAGDPAGTRAATAALHVARGHRQAGAALALVEGAMEGDPASQRRLQEIAASARAEPHNRRVQVAATAVRAVTQALRRGAPPPATSTRVRPASTPASRSGIAPRALPPAQGIAPRSVRIVQEGGRRVLRVEL